MTEQTAKHREEAREIVIAFSRCPEDWDVLTTEFASALSSRDSEIREVLEGLVTHVDFDVGGNPIRHWCAVSDDGDSECDDACLAARGLWNRVNLTEPTE